MGRAGIEVLSYIVAGGGVAVLILLALAFAISTIVRAFRGGGRKRSRAEEAEETEMIQEIYHGMNRMGERVEALETLLLRDDKQARDKFDRELRRD